MNDTTRLAVDEQARAELMRKLRTITGCGCDRECRYLEIARKAYELGVVDSFILGRARRQP